ncbi:MAG TPA: M20/M25/M40 family metallo-hydrolase [Isosphaeraceae bacterium]
MLVATALLATLPLAPTRAAGPEPDSALIRKHVATLASPEFGGRRGPVAEKSRTYLIDEFKRLGLRPLFDGSFVQDIPDREPGSLMGRNVGAKLVGSDPKLRDEWVIVAAHFDHLGVRDGVLYPGADDNASAVAMMLEVARCLVASPEKPRRSVMFLGFDLEERALFGSRYFVEHSPIPLDKVALFVTADMIGRSLAGVGTDFVFVLGTERWPASRAWLREASRDKPLRVGLLGADLLLLDRSDYGPFRARKVPFLFFSTGENPCYHTPDDRPETLDYPKAAAISRVMYDVIRRAIQADDRPVWREPADNGMDEARSLRVVLKMLREHSAELKIGRTPSYFMDQALTTLDGLVERGRIEPSERASVIRMAQLVMAAIF